MRMPLVVAMLGRQQRQKATRSSSPRPRRRPGKPIFEHRTMTVFPSLELRCARGNRWRGSGAEHALEEVCLAVTASDSDMDFSGAILSSL